MLKNSINILLLPVFFYAGSPMARDIEWDLGAGLASVNFDLYPGASDKKSYIFPIPYFTLVSKKLEIDRGIRGFLFTSDRVVLDVSADFGIPVNSSDSRVRNGMPDLDTVLQLGPSLEFILLERKQQRFDVRFELPLRAVIASDIKHTRNEGWLLEPCFSIEQRRYRKKGPAFKLTFGARYATRDFHAYYYDVDPAFATLERPQFSSDKGFGGTFVNLRGSWRKQDLILWAFIRHQNLRGSVFEQSPLIQDRDYYLIGVGFAWVFARNL